jgi:hypothetical protein
MCTRCDCSNRISADRSHNNGRSTRHRSSPCFGSRIKFPSRLYYSACHEELSHSKVEIRSSTPRFHSRHRLLGTPSSRCPTLAFHEDSVLAIVGRVWRGEAQIPLRPVPIAPCTASMPMVRLQVIELDAYQHSLGRRSCFENTIHFRLTRPLDQLAWDMGHSIGQDNRLASQ